MLDPVTTYRVQFHKGFTFTDFEQVIPYLHQLGIKTVYASPIFEATPGSTHGYDVVNPLNINPEIGTIGQLKNISRQLKKLDIGWLQDIVPNHMAFHPNNRWLMDVLEKGRRSAYADYFDILWDSPIYDGRLMVPFLGGQPDELLNDKQVQVSYQNGNLYFIYADQQYPLNLISYGTLLGRLEEQDVDITEIIEKIKLADRIGDSQTYTQVAGELKQVNTPFFDNVFTKSFLKKINDDTPLLQHIAAEQYYQLCYWQETDKQINYRRFFTVNGLICLNIQHQEVFDTYHQLIRTLSDEGIFQGLRVDHIDGLYDPEKYLAELRRLAGNNAFIIVEKILEKGELFPACWPVQGNTGYDFLAVVNNLFTNTDSEKYFARLYQQLIADEQSVQQGITDKKTLILNKQMGGELDNLYHLFTGLELNGEKELAAIEPEKIKAAIAGLLVGFPVYRFYGNTMPLKKEESDAVDSLLKSISHKNPDLADAIKLLASAIIEQPLKRDTVFNEKALKFYQRCMQFTGPLMAKGVEDTLMYTYNRFVDHNEVGDSPEAFGISVEEYHELMKERQRLWPLSMNATSTHDTKRGEDVRARLNVLTDIADEWAATVAQWKQMNAALKQHNAPDNNDEYFIYQTITGACPMPGEDEDNFTERLQEYMIKALREGKTNSNWSQPNEEYENAVKNFITTLLNPLSDFWKSFSAFQQRIADYGIINSLAQVLLKYTSPGMPDLYQGCELWDLSLVDPDNRRPVDYRKRQGLLDEVKGSAQWKKLWDNRYNAQIKLTLTHNLLKQAGKNAALFADGNYIPLKTKGRYKDNILAFARQWGQHWRLIAVPLHLAAISKRDDDPIDFDWNDTRISLPGNAPLSWQNLLNGGCGHAIEGNINVKELFTDLPLALLQLNYPQNGRSAGILMHITSLPSKFGIGDLGPGAIDFADFLLRAGQRYWQMLPVNPVDKLAGFSPYSAVSGVAGNTLLISPELLMADGLLKENDLGRYYTPAGKPAEFEKVKVVKEALFEIAWKNFSKNADDAMQQQFTTYKNEQSAWLNDYALYELLKLKHKGQPWHKWPAAYKNRDAAALDKTAKQQTNLLDKIKWLQFIFARQWAAFKSYCNKNGITLFGDMPFYISYDSADVWSQPQLFSLDKNKNMAGMAGVPPDYFSAEGQLWGMPVYCWDELKRTGYAWWLGRIKKNLEYFDLIRLDHFRAFADYWEVPGGQQTAVNGAWKKGPGADFFETVKNELGKLPFVAEDLGEINEAVYYLRDQFSLPGMKVLQFAFDEAMPFSDHIPHNYTTNTFAYTGTHDNNTLHGWYRQDIGKAGRKRIDEYLGKKLNADKACKNLIVLCYSSVAKIVIIPVQDILGLDEKSRMNIPSSADGNWAWRLEDGLLTKKIAKYLHELTAFYNR